MGGSQKWAPATLGFFGVAEGGPPISFSFFVYIYIVGLLLFFINLLFKEYFCFKTKFNFKNYIFRMI